MERGREGRVEGGGRVSEEREKVEVGGVCMEGRGEWSYGWGMMWGKVGGVKRSGEGGSDLLSGFHVNQR